jgi:hypothetical protein
VAERSVRGFDAPGGVPSNSTAKSVPFEVNVPGGTTSMEVWFRNFTGAGHLARARGVGNGGSSFSRACARAEGVPASMVLDSYVQQRACAFVEVDVWVPGLTDSGESGVASSRMPSPAATAWRSR